MLKCDKKLTSSPSSREQDRGRVRRVGRNALRRPPAAARALRGRVADACVLLALIRNGANAPAFSDAPPFALQRRACAAGTATASSGAPPRLDPSPTAAKRLAHRRVRPSRLQPRHRHDDRVGVRRRRLECATVPPLRARLHLPSPATRPQLLLDPGRPRPLQGPAAVDPLLRPGGGFPTTILRRAGARAHASLFRAQTCNFDVLYSYLTCTNCAPTPCSPSRRPATRSPIFPFLRRLPVRHPEGVRFRLSTLSAALGRHRAR